MSLAEVLEAAYALDLEANGDDCGTSDSTAEPDETKACTEQGTCNVSVKDMLKNSKPKVTGVL